MASENVMEFTDQNFEQEVLRSDKPVLVDFWAEWCPPCRLLVPVVDRLAAEYAGRVKFGKINTESNLKIASQYRIQNIPTVLFVKNGEVVKTMVGFRPSYEQEFKDVLNGLL